MEDEDELLPEKERRRRARAFDDLVEAVWAQTRSNVDLVRSNARLVRMNQVLIVIITAFGVIGRYFALTWARDVRKQVDENVIEIRHLKEVCRTKEEEVP